MWKHACLYSGNTSYPYPHADANEHIYVDTNGDANSNINSDTDANSHPNLDPNTDTGNADSGVCRHSE
jgi:hypothetical protein